MTSRFDLEDRLSKAQLEAATANGVVVLAKARLEHFDSQQVLRDLVPARPVGEVRKRPGLSSRLHAVWTGAAWIVFGADDPRETGWVVKANDRNNTWDGLTIEEWAKL